MPSNGAGARFQCLLHVNFAPNVPYYRFSIVLQSVFDDRWQFYMCSLGCVGDTQVQKLQFANKKVDRVFRLFEKLQRVVKKFSRKLHTAVGGQLSSSFVARIFHALDKIECIVDDVALELNLV